MNKQITYHEKKYTVQDFPVIIVLDNLNDPRNVGIILRLADSFGVRKIYACGFTPVPPNTIIKRTARSAEQHLNIIKFANVSDALNKLKEENYYLVGLEYTTKSESIRNFNFTGSLKTAIIAGSEETGVSAETLKIVDHTCHITQFGHGLSLNVSSALAIALYEITAQLNAK